MTAKTVTIHRPDDWHLHLRDDDLMRAVLPFTCRVFSRAIVMPNLQNPVTTTAAAVAYRDRILAALPPGSRFQPLMTCYLTDHTDTKDLCTGFREKVFAAAKLYPAGATTNSANGVTDLDSIRGVLDTLQDMEIPLLVHGEIVDPAVDFFDREPVFIERVLEPVRKDFPDLKIVFEHITTTTAVAYVLSNPERLGATITPHHLTINRNAIFKDGLNPHMYCLPIAKREKDRMALRRAATSGDARFFLGTDSAPHFMDEKESGCGKAGIFNAPSALPWVAQVFEEENALENLDAFVALNGAGFYGMPPNGDQMTLGKNATETAIPDTIDVKGRLVRVFKPAAPLHWDILPTDPAKTPPD